MLGSVLFGVAFGLASALATAASGGSLSANCLSFIVAGNIGVLLPSAFDMAADAVAAGWRKSFS